MHTLCDPQRCESRPWTGSSRDIVGPRSGPVRKRYDVMRKFDKSDLFATWETERSTQLICIVSRLWGRVCWVVMWGAGYIWKLARPKSEATRACEWGALVDIRPIDRRFCGYAADQISDARLFSLDLTIAIYPSRHFECSPSLEAGALPRSVASLL